MNKMWRGDVLGYVMIRVIVQRRGLCHHSLSRPVTSARKV